VNQGYGVMFSPKGYGGVLDQSALAVLRHASFSVLRIISIKYSIIAPILMSGTLVAFSNIIEKSSLSVRGACAVIALILAIKMFPVLELGLRYGDGLLLILTGFLIVIWAVLAGDESNINAKTVSLGGMLILIGSKSPVGAVLWAILWLKGFRTFSVSRFPGLIISLFGLVILYTQVFERISFESGIMTGIFSITAVAIGITRARLFENRDYSYAGPYTIAIPLFILASKVIHEWPLWGDKLEISFHFFIRSASITLSSMIVGWILIRYFKGILRDVSEQTVGVGTRAVWSAAVRWIIPLVDIVAVIWVAMERFLWQGLTLFGPRRVLYHISDIIGWFDSRILNAIRLIPIQLVNALDHVLKRIIRFPGIIILLFCLSIIICYFRGIIQ